MAVLVLVIFATIAALGSAQNPFCTVCGCSTCEIGNPNGVIEIEPELKELVFGMESILCHQFNQAGLAGLLAPAVCALNTQQEILDICGCKDPFPAIQEPDQGPNGKIPSQVEGQSEKTSGQCSLVSSVTLLLWIGASYFLLFA